MMKDWIFLILIMFLFYGEPDLFDAIREKLLQGVAATPSVTVPSSPESIPSVVPQKW